MGRRGSTRLPEYVPHPATTPPESPDLLEQLSFEHRRLQRMWSELQLAHRRHVEEPHRAGARLGLPGQRALGAELVRILDQHDARETERLYPIVARVEGGDWAERAAAEHADLRDLLAEEEGENPEDEGVFALYAEALDRLLAHIDEEERVIFPLLRAAAPAGELADPGPIERPQWPPHPDVIDLAAEERASAATAPAAGGRDRQASRRRLGLRRH
jgi:hypothetical protein